MAFNIQTYEHAHRNRWPHLNGLASLASWRQAKEIADKANERAEKDMTDSFGCHGEPIANAISETIWKLFDMLPAGKEREAKEALTLGFQAICDQMTDVRRELDSLIDKMANEQRQEGFEEASSCIPSGCDLQAHDYGVDLNTSLEDAFERGVDAVSSWRDDAYCESVSLSMDDL